MAEAGRERASKSSHTHAKEHKEAYRAYASFVLLNCQIRIGQKTMVWLKGNRPQVRG